jgi:hypothetical protein
MRIEQRMEHEMRAFHADPALKQEILTQLKTHAQAGEILNRAHVWNDGKGGPVACMIHDTDLAMWQERTGTPKAVGSALDLAASYLDGPDQAAAFAIEWVDAVEVGQDLRGVAPALLAWLLSDGEHGILRFAEPEAVRQAIDRVTDLHRRAAAGDVPPEAEWRAARAAAMAATDACENALQKSLAAAGEAAAWNPATSTAAVSDTIRAWTSLFPRRVPGLVGRGAMLDSEIREWVAKLKADAEQAGLPAPNVSEHDLCVAHPAVVALKRSQIDEIKRAQRDDRHRLAEILLKVTWQSTTWQSAAASICA